MTRTNLWEYVDPRVKPYLERLMHGGNVRTVLIDLNVRTAEGTYAGLEDADGPVTAGETVHVCEPESNLCGLAQVASVDQDRRLIFLRLRWADLAPGQAARGRR